MACRIVNHLRLQAVRVTFLALPAAHRRSEKALSTGLCRTATNARMDRGARTAARPPQMVRRPRRVIGMKLSINSGCKFSGFMAWVQALTQYLCGGSPFARRLCRQTFCSGTSPLEKAAQCEFRLKDRVHPLLSQGLKMPDEFEHTQFPLFLQPHGCTPLRVERIREQNEQHAAIEIT